MIKMTRCELSVGRKMIRPSVQGRRTNLMATVCEFKRFVPASQARLFIIFPYPDRPRALRSIPPPTPRSSHETHPQR